MKTPLTSCVYCGYKINEATDVEGNPEPKENDISLCFKCGGLMQFNQDFTLRKIDEDAYHEVIQDDDLRETIFKIRRAMK